MMRYILKLLQPRVLMRQIPPFLLKPSLTNQLLPVLLLLHSVAQAEALEQPTVYNPIHPISLLFPLLCEDVGVHMLN